MNKYVNTKNALAAALDITPQALYKNWISREDWPAETQRGWNVEKCLEYKLSHDRRRTVTDGPNADLERRGKLAIVETAEEKLAILRRESITIAEHDAEVRTVVNITLDAWRFLRQEFAASLKDAEVLRRFDKAEEVARERALLRIDEEA